MAVGLLVLLKSIAFAFALIVPVLLLVILLGDGGAEIAGMMVGLFFDRGAIRSLASILPSIPFVIGCEWAGVRSWRYYVIGLGITMAMAPVVATGALGQPLALLMYAGVGLVVGLVYCLIAVGR